MGFTTADQLVNAMANGKLQKLPFCKGYNSTTAGVPKSLWQTSSSRNTPATGSSTSTGKANGRVCVGGQNGSLTVGALPYTNAAAGTTMHLTALSLSMTGQAGVMWLFDRVADVNLSFNETTGSITGCTAVSRLAGTSGLGDGCQLWLEVATASNGGTQTFAFGYTNQNGTSNRSTGNVSVGGAQTTTVGNTALGTSGFFVPLQAGDTGVRSLDSITLNSAIGLTGNFNACLVRPLCHALVTSAQVSHMGVERDTMTDLPSLPLLYDDTCFMVVMVGEVSNTGFVVGDIYLASN